MDVNSRCPLDIGRCYELSESFLEREFWHFVDKMDRRTISRIEPQPKLGKYRGDSLFEMFGGFRLVIELDGETFHDRNRDWKRDKEILRAGLADEIVRIPYRALHYYPDATIACLGRWFLSLEKPQPVTCLSVWELREEIENARETHESTRQFLEDIEHIYDVFYVNESFGTVGSPKGFMYGWDIPNIRRYRERPTAVKQ